MKHKYQQDASSDAPPVLASSCHIEIPKMTFDLQHYLFEQNKDKRMSGIWSA